MRYMMPDGKVFAGRSYRDVVESMSEEKFSTPDSIESYRKAAAKRATRMYGKKIEDRDDKSFILSLEAAGIIRRSSK